MMSNQPWMIVVGDFSESGGMERANFQLAKYLAQDRPVTLVSHSVVDSLASHPNVTVVPVARPFGKHIFGEPLLARSAWKSAERLSRQFARVVVNGGNCFWPDVNWVHCVHAAFPAPTAGNVLNALKIRHTHQRNIRLERLAILKSKTIICNSHRTANDVVNLIGVTPDRVRVVYLGIDPLQFPPITPELRRQSRDKLGLSERPWVGFIGQLGNRIKGFDKLYDAWVRLCKTPGWDANLLVIGAGATLHDWQRRSAADGLAGRIQFFGFRTDIPEIIAACDAMIQPSRYDAYGLAVQEGICRGLPVLVSHNAGISERYPPELVDLVIPDPEDTSDIVERLYHWRQNLNKLAELTKPFSDQLRAHTWDDMAKEFVAAVGTGES